MTRVHTIILISCTALLLATSGTAAVQETTTASIPTEAATATTPATTSESSSETTYYGNMAGNRIVRIVSTECIDGTTVLILESGLPRTVVVTAPTSSTSTDTATGNLVRRPIPLERMTIQIDSPEPQVTLVTSYSVEDGRYIEVRFDDGGPALITGPFTRTDVRNTTIDGAPGMSFGALLIIVRRRFGLHHDVERVA